MQELLPVLVPLINTNEADALLVNLAVKEGQWVEAGALLAVFETTKAAADLTAERKGYVLGLCFKVGETIHAGECFCYLSATADAPLPVEEEIQTPVRPAPTPEGLRITQPAMTLMQELGVSLEQLPQDTLITEKYVRELFAPAARRIDPTALVIYGGGGHAKSLIELIQVEGKYHVVGILDDHLVTGTMMFGIPVLGNGDFLLRLKSQGIGLVVNAVGGIGDILPRLRIYEKIKAAGLTVPSVVHPRSYVEKSARLSGGEQIFFNAYVGSDVTVGFGCIVNTGAILSHDCVLGDYVNISPGAILAGAVQVDERSLIGMGATINLGVKIGSGVRVGNSAVVKADVPQNSIVRAGAIWPDNKNSN
jgi:sugar O-acyltransferase (sialic acid O-acetyltransferase NeuD family)